jgi:hypothetical protein
MSNHRRIIARALLSGGVAAAFLSLGAATAQASPGPLPTDGPVPPGASGPYTCCPQDRAGGLHPQTGRGCPGPGVNWDTNVCHTWYGVVWGHGNASPSVWEGGPPPPEATQKPACGFPFMCSGTP